MTLIRVRSVSSAVALLLGLLVTATATPLSAATAPPFEGEFAAATTVLQLNFNPITSGYIGQLRIDGRTYPVEGTAPMSTTFSGRYLRDTQPVALKGVLRGATLTLTQSGSSRELTRLTPSRSATTVPKLGAPVVAPSGFAVGVTVRNTPAFPLPIPGGQDTGESTGSVLIPAPKAKTAKKAVAKVSTLARPGMRLTFFLGSSTNQIGKVPVNANDVTFSASAGYVQLNILDVSDGQITAETRQYVPTSTDNKLTLASATTSVFSAETGGDGYWRSPAALETLVDKPDGDETVARVTYPLDGKSYRAIRTTSRTPTSTTQHTYDLATGVLLSYGFNGTGAGGSTQVIQLLFKGARETKLPWIGQQRTAAVTGLRSLNFSGQYATVVDSVYSAVWPMKQNWKITKVDVASVQFEQTTTLSIGGSTPNETKASVVMALTGLWVSPKVLAALREGEVIDDDPITQARLTVTSTDNGTVVLTVRNDVQSGSSAFDAKTGVIVAIQTETRNGIGTTTTFLQRTK